VRVLQDGALAPVSLGFVTVEAAAGQGGHGCKALELLKVAGQWRIASEFYTGDAMPPTQR
jgi:hypothetical protein